MMAEIIRLQKTVSKPEEVSEIKEDAKLIKK
jgi:hypothetical protein